MGKNIFIVKYKLKRLREKEAMNKLSSASQQPDTQDSYKQNISSYTEVKSNAMFFMLYKDTDI